MKYIITFLLLNILSASAYSEEGSFGVETDVITTGLFPTKLESVTIATIEKGSSASKAGIKQGDKVVSIGGCLIPGCSAFKAKKLMQKEKGEQLEFEIVSEGGEVIKHSLIAE